MVKRDPNAHQSNHYKSTHHSGGKDNKKSGGKAGKGNKSINKFLGIGKPGPHLLKHKKLQEAKKKHKGQGSTSDNSKNKGSHNNNNNISNSKNNNSNSSNNNKNTNNNNKDKHLFGNQNVSTFVNGRILHNNKKKALRKLIPTSSNNSNNNTNNNNAIINANTNRNRSNSLSEEMTFTTPNWDAQGNAIVPPISHVDNSNHAEYQTDINYQYQPAPVHEEEERAKRRLEKKLRRKSHKHERKLIAKQAKSKEDQTVVPNQAAAPAAGSSPHRPISLDSPSTAADDTDDSSDSKDEMQRGDDFIGFGDEASENELDAVIASNNRTPAEPSHAGQKRKRDPDNGSDTEGATGPPPGCPWMGHRQYSKLPSVPIMLTQELKDFVDFLSPTPEEHQVRKYVIQWIAKTVSELWPDSEVHVFGSYDTQLYLPSSDLDLVVLRARDFSKEDLYKLSRHLKAKQVTNDVQVIAKARVPIIKFKERLSKIPVDISFNITNGIESAEIVRNYMETTPALRSMTMLIKHFLMIKGQNEVFQGGIGSYTTMIMILSFLQMHPQIQANKLNPEDNLGVLLIEFFELYGLCFNYNQVGISVANGGSYFLKPPNNNPNNRELLLSSIDPNDPTNDTAKGSYALRMIREVFVGAYGTLTKTVQQRHRVLFGGGSSQTSSHYRFDDHNRVPADSRGKSSALHHQTQVSLIRDVLSIPLDVQQGRQHLERVFYSGHFQDIFDDPHGAHGLTE